MSSNSYVGLVVLLLVPLAFVGRDRARRALAAFLAVLTVIAAGAAYHWPGVADVIGIVPLVRSGPNQRYILIVQLALALLAALGVEGLLTVGRTRARLLAVLLDGVAMAALGLGLPVLWAHGFFGLPTTGPAVGVWTVALERAAVLLGAGLLVLLGVVALRRLRPRWVPAAAMLLPLLLLADLWQAHGDYNPAVAPTAYYPSTPLTTWLQGQPGLFRSVAPGWILMPNTNVPYGLSVLGGYDSVMPATYYNLIVRIDPSQRFLTTGGFSALRQVVSPLLNLLNVRYVLVPPGDDPNYAPDVVQEQSSGQTVGPIAGRTRPGQTFVAGADNLARIQVLGATYGKALTGTLTFHLRTDPPGPADLVTQPIDAATLPDNTFWTITFPPIARSAGRRYAFYFDAPQAREGNAATLWYDGADVYPDGSRTDGGQPADGDLAFRVYSLREPGAAWFAPVTPAPGAAAVFTNTRVLPRAWLTHRVQVEPDPTARPKVLADPAFDAAGTALLDVPLPASDVLPATPPPGGADHVDVTAYAPEQVTIATDSPAPGVLVLADQAFPGWEATVDGQAAPIVTADHALRGVYLPAGAHTVVFTYRPGSFVLGAGLSAAGLLGLAGLLAAPRLRRRGTAS